MSKKANLTTAEWEFIRANADKLYDRDILCKLNEIRLACGVEPIRTVWTIREARYRLSLRKQEGRSLCQVQQDVIPAHLKHVLRIESKLQMFENEATAATADD